MLSLQKISITHFKNYEISSFCFDKSVIGICGLNGKGKTNLLDAIYYCCFTKSYFPGSDTLNIKFNQEGFRIESSFLLNEKPQHIVVINRVNAKKEFYLNQSVYEKLSQHIGLLPAVIVAPDDIDIINGSSDGRRKYIDTLISQLDNEYLQSLILHNKILLQRNSLLKNIASGNINDFGLLDVLDDQLSIPAQQIYNKRKVFLEKLLPMIILFYKNIADNDENLIAFYDSKICENNYKELLTINRQKDVAIQRTSVGIHKDDLLFELNDQVFKNIASQGQKKSLLFAMKLAEYETIKNSKGFTPLLLLDDVFEKLDDKRITNLLDWVCNKNKGQVFITDTHKERLENTFNQLEIDGQIIEL